MKEEAASLFLTASSFLFPLNLQTMAINKIIVPLLSGMILLQLIGCHEPQVKVQENTVDDVRKDTFKQIVSENSVKDSVDSNFLEKPLVDCKLNRSPEQKEEEEFINSNIQFFQVKSMPDKHLINQEYCRSVLINTKFLSFSESNFLPGYFEFAHFYTNIDHYGKCFIGKFYFPEADNSAQRRAVIIIQVDKKELSILNFDDVKFVGGKLSCDFNVRGKHFIHNLKYSNECKRFIE